MHDVHIRQGAGIPVEVAQKEIHVMQIIELPAFGDERVPQQIAQRHRVRVARR